MTAKWWKPPRMRQLFAEVNAELRQAARGWALVVLRLLTGVPLLVVLLVVLPWGSGTGVALREVESALLASGRTLEILTGLTLFVLFPVAGLVSITSWARERREDTLGVLLMSTMRPSEIVLGKLLAAVAVCSTPVLAALPLLSTLMFYSGTSSAALVVLAVVGSLKVIAGASLGLWLGARFTSQLRAIVLLSLVYITALSLPVVAFVTNSSLTDFLLAISPMQTLVVFSLENLAFSSSARLMPFAPLAVVLFAHTIFLVAACRTVPRIASLRPGKSLRERMRALDEVFRSSKPHADAEPAPPRGNPVFWREMTRSGLRGRHTRRALLYASLLPAFALLIVSFVMAGSSFAHDTLSLLDLGLGGLALVVSAVAAATALPREREQGSLDLLLTTPLPASQLVLGQGFGVLVWALPVFLPAWLITGWLVEFAETSHGGYSIAFFVSLLVLRAALFVCVVLIGCFCSLIFRRALVSSIAALLLSGAGIFLFGVSVEQAHASKGASIVLTLVPAVIGGAAILHSFEEPTRRMTLIVAVALVLLAGALIGQPLGPLIVPAMRWYWRYETSVAWIWWIFLALWPPALASFLYIRRYADQLIGRIR